MDRVWRGVGFGMRGIGSWRYLAMPVAFIVCEISLDAPASSLAIMVAAIAEFILLLLFGRSHDFIIILEGALFAAVDYTAMLLGTAGAGVMLLELAGATALLGSSAVDRPLLARYARRIPLIPTSGDMITRVNLAFGLLLLAHGGLMAVMTLLGGVDTALAIASFLALYAILLLALRRVSRQEAVASLPRLVSADGGDRLRVGGETLAELSREGERIVTVRHLAVSGNRRPEEVLRSLETALAAAGAKTVRFEEWPGDEIQLEIAGYYRVEEVWQKVLPVTAERRVSL